MLQERPDGDAGREVGEYELDESYFGARRVRGKPSRGAAGKTPVFGLPQARGQGVRDGRPRLLEGVADAGHKGANP